MNRLRDLQVEGMLLETLLALVAHLLPQSRWPGISAAEVVALALLPPDAGWHL